MPWTLYRYILRELVTLLVLTTAVMVLVISFLAAIRPLTDGLLGPMSLMKFVAYTAPTMLGFALPFAGAFAATLVFIRLANDNEITACSANGLSYATVLLPVAALGLALTMGLFVLSNYVVPKFYRAAAQTLESDVVTMVVNRLNDGQPVELEKDELVLYADYAEELPPPDIPDSDVPPAKFVALRGVAVGQLDERGRLLSDETAQNASINVFHHEGRSWVTLRLEHVVRFDPQRGELGYVRLFEVPAIRLPNPFRDSPQFFSLPQLRQLNNEPERFDRIESLKYEYAQAVAIERLRRRMRDIVNGSADTPRLVLNSPRGPEQFTITAPSAVLTHEAVLLRSQPGQSVTVEYGTQDRTRRRFEAESAAIEMSGGQNAAHPSVYLELVNVRVYDLLGGEPNEHASIGFPSLTWPEAMLSHPVAQIRISELHDEAQAQSLDASQDVRQAARRLLAEINELAHRIVGQLHQRSAAAVSCLLLLVLGALLSIQNRGQMPLVVYFWSVLLAITSILIMHSGLNMASGTKFALGVGLAVMWSGNVMLAAVAGAVYCKIAKN